MASSSEEIIIESERTVVKYSGWGPCSHSDEEELELELTYYIRDENGTLWDLERLLWELGMYGTTECACDQWVGVGFTGNLRFAGEKPLLGLHMWIEADSFYIALTESYKQLMRLREKYKNYE